MKKAKRRSAVSILTSVIFSLALVAAVISSSGCYADKMTVKEWLLTEEGKEYSEELQKTVPDENFPKFNYYAETDNILIAEYVCKEGLKLDSDNINSTVDKMRPVYKKSIQEFMDEYDVKEFAIVMRYKGADGKIQGERIITLNS